MNLVTSFSEQISQKIHHADLIKLNGKAVSYTHLRAHETVLDLVCRLLLEKKKNKINNNKNRMQHININQTETIYN